MGEGLTIERIVSFLRVLCNAGPVVTVKRCSPPHSGLEETEPGSVLPHSPLRAGTWMQTHAPLRDSDSTLNLDYVTNSITTGGDTGSFRVGDRGASTFSLSEGPRPHAPRARGAAPPGRARPPPRGACPREAGSGRLPPSVSTPLPAGWCGGGRSRALSAAPGSHVSPAAAEGCERSSGMKAAAPGGAGVWDQQVRTPTPSDPGGSEDAPCRCRLPSGAGCARLWLPGRPWRVSSERSEPRSVWSFSRKS